MAIDFCIRGPPSPSPPFFFGGGGVGGLCCLHQPTSYIQIYISTHSHRVCDCVRACRVCVCVSVYVCVCLCLFRRTYIAFKSLKEGLTHKTKIASRAITIWNPTVHDYQEQIHTNQSIFAKIQKSSNRSVSILQQQNRCKKYEIEIKHNYAKMA